MYLKVLHLQKSRPINYLICLASMSIKGKSCRTFYRINVISQTCYYCAKPQTYMESLVREGWIEHILRWGEALVKIFSSATYQNPVIILSFDPFIWLFGCFSSNYRLKHLKQIKMQDHSEITDRFIIERNTYVAKNYFNLLGVTQLWSMNCVLQCSYGRTQLHNSRKLLTHVHSIINLNINVTQQTE